MVNLLPTIRLAQSILKHNFPSVDKPQGLFSEFYGMLCTALCCIKVKFNIYVVCDYTFFFS